MSKYSIENRELFFMKYNSKNVKYLLRRTNKLLYRLSYSADSVYHKSAPNCLLFLILVREEIDCLG